MQIPLHPPPLDVFQAWWHAYGTEGQALLLLRGAALTSASVAGVGGGDPPTPSHRSMVSHASSQWNAAIFQAAADTGSGGVRLRQHSLALLAAVPLEIWEGRRRRWSALA